jgi:hypothetical protein
LATAFTVDTFLITQLVVATIFIVLGIAIDRNLKAAIAKGNPSPDAGSRPSAR